MISVRKRITVTIDIQNATEVAKARAGWFARLVAIPLMSSESIKERVEDQVSQILRAKLANNLPHLVQNVLQSELSEQGIQAEVEVR